MSRIDTAFNKSIDNSVQKHNFENLVRKGIIVRTNKEIKNVTST